MFNAQAYLLKLLKDKNEKKFVCPAGWVIEFNNGANSCFYQDCGWSVYNLKTQQHLHKNFTLNTRSTGWLDSHKFGEAPGYWPTKQEAEAALAAYLEREK